MRAGVASGGGAAMPGMIFNMKKRISYTDAASGEQRSVHAGRMECTMQVGGAASALMLLRLYFDSTCRLVCHQAAPEGEAQSVRIHPTVGHLRTGAHSQALLNL